MFLNNISEYLLEQLVAKKVSESEVAFWFKLNMKYHEKVNPAGMERCLTLLGLFYSSLNKVSLAEALYTEAITKLESNSEMTYTLVLAKNLLGRLLLRSDRKDKGMLHLQQSEKLAAILPFWWQHSEHLILESFDF